MGCFRLRSLGQGSCDASVDENGEGCVWCEISRFGFCVSYDQAQAMKQALPTLSCDDTPSSDDSVPTDDAAPTNDDPVPDDYWECLKDYSDKSGCLGGGCEWCLNKAGYGICLSKEAADKVNKYDWFDCTDTIFEHDIEDNRADIHIGKLLDIKDPLDPTCLQATLMQSESVCESTADVDGNPCEWCVVSGTNFCLNGDQAAIAQELGGECASTNEIGSESFATSCALASLSGHTECLSTFDEDGFGCDWCTVRDFNICLNYKQASFALKLGGSCDEKSVADESLAAVDFEDPFDMSCLQATVDQASCAASTDSEGNHCQFCDVGGVGVCLNPEQAQMAEMTGGDCSSAATARDEQDPYDPTCLQSSLQGDESICDATVDSDGNPCEWCSVASVNLCLSSEQAEAIELLGGSCNSKTT